MIKSFTLSTFYKKLVTPKNSWSFFVNVLDNLGAQNNVFFSFSFFNDAAYREAIENSANFNTRLCVERRLRMPFLDPQTGVAQNHCSLFMSKHQRMPGVREGQLYTYPAARWRKARRQYLSYNRGRWGGNIWGNSNLGIGNSDGLDGPGIEVTGDGTSLDAHDTDSKDSHRDGQIKDDPKVNISL